MPPLALRANPRVIAAYSGKRPACSGRVARALYRKARGNATPGQAAPRDRGIINDMKNDLHIPRFVWWTVALVALTVLSGHGGGTAQVVDQPIGALRATVWTEPEAPRVGEAFHITVALYRADADHDTPMTDAQVTVRLTGPDGTVLERVAELDPGPPPVFATDLTLPQPGEWQVAVQVDAAQGQGTLHFTVHAEAAAQGPAWWLWAALAGATVSVVGWWWQRRRAAG